MPDPAPVTIATGPLVSTAVVLMKFPAGCARHDFPLRLQFSPYRMNCVPNPLPDHIIPGEQINLDTIPIFWVALFQ
jgi:hypothetical protein